MNFIRHQRLALVGLPGSGKSTVGRQLARRLNVDFFDSDLYIERRLRSSIRDFFAREGEEAFRNVEQEVITELTQGDPCVLSTGGGVVLREGNRAQLRLKTVAVYLHTSPEEVFRRIKHDKTRPLLQVPDPLGRLHELYEFRDPLYRAVAKIVIETGRPSVGALVSLIFEQLELHGTVFKP